MSGEKNIDGYEALHSVRIDGEDEIVACKTEDAESRYRLYRRLRDNPLIEEIRVVFETDDYLKAMREFTRRINAGLDRLALDRVYRGYPLTDYPLSAADCVTGGMDTHLAGRVIAIKAEALSPEYRSRSHQLMLATGGFGCAPDASGRAVYCTNLYSGEKGRWDRSDILGAIPEDRLPEWAREKLTVLRGGSREGAQKEPVAQNLGQRESTLAKIREAKSKPSAPRKPKTERKPRGEEL